LTQTKYCAKLENNLPRPFGITFARLKKRSLIMREVLAFSAILTAVAFLISSFAVFWPEYRAAQKRDAAGTEDVAGAGGAADAATAGVGAAAAVAGAGSGQSGYYPIYNTAGPEDMKRYLFNYPACPAQEQEEEKEGLALAARD
jgi:hypothetical protein